MNMNTRFSYLLVTAALLHLNSIAQKTVRYDLAGLLKKNEIVTFDSLKTKPLKNSLPGAISTKGVIWFKHISFTEGTIDLDLRGKDVFLKSFLGIVFHGKDTVTYDVLYFRPFNFGHADPARRKWSVQYMSLPDHDYLKLRQEHPFTFENEVIPVPEPDEWFHATIVIKGDRLKVHVNYSYTPSLEVRLLNDRRNGLFGLYTDGLSADFANLTIKH